MNGEQTAPRCESCKFWQRLTAAPGFAPGFEPTADTFHLWGKCERQNDPALPTVMFTQDASDYSSWLTTRDLFSCSEWNAR